MEVQSRDQISVENGGYEDGPAGLVVCTEGLGPAQTGDVCKAGARS